MPAHKHAELMRQYTEDAFRSETPWEFWECRSPAASNLGNILDHPRWENESDYRRKPKKIIINGHEINGPVRKALPHGAAYFLVLPIAKEKFHQMVWGGTEQEHEWLQHGLIHLTQEDAIAHARALLSFTEVK